MLYRNRIIALVVGTTTLIGIPSLSAINFEALAHKKLMTAGAFGGLTLAALAHEYSNADEEVQEAGFLSFARERIHNALRNPLKSFDEQRLFNSIVWSGLGTLTAQTIGTIALKQQHHAQQKEQQRRNIEGTIAQLNAEITRLDQALAAQKIENQLQSETIKELTLPITARLERAGSAIINNTPAALRTAASYVGHAAQQTPAAAVHAAVRVGAITRQSIILAKKVAAGARYFTPIVIHYVAAISANNNLNSAEQALAEADDATDVREKISLYEDAIDCYARAERFFILASSRANAVYIQRYYAAKANECRTHTGEVNTQLRNTINALPPERNFVQAAYDTAATRATAAYQGVTTRATQARDAVVATKNAAYQAIQSGVTQTRDTITTAGARAVATVTGIPTAMRRAYYERQVAALTDHADKKAFKAADKNLDLDQARQLYASAIADAKAAHAYCTDPLLSGQMVPVVTRINEAVNEWKACAQELTTNNEDAVSSRRQPAIVHPSDPTSVAVFESYQKARTLLEQADTSLFIDQRSAITHYQEPRALYMHARNKLENALAMYHAADNDEYTDNINYLNALLNIIIKLDSYALNQRMVLANAIEEGKGESELNIIYRSFIDFEKAADKELRAQVTQRPWPSASTRRAFENLESRMATLAESINHTNDINEKIELYRELISVTKKAGEMLRGDERMQQAKILDVELDHHKNALKELERQLPTRRQRITEAARSATQTLHAQANSLAERTSFAYNATKNGAAWCMNNVTSAFNNARTTTQTAAAELKAKFDGAHARDLFIQVTEEGEYIADNHKKGMLEAAHKLVTSAITATKNESFKQELQQLQRIILEERQKLEAATNNQQRNASRAQNASKRNNGRKKK